MKTRKYSLYWTMATVMMMTVWIACNKEHEPDVAVITMTAKAKYVRFFMTGSGAVTIDWGDATAKEKYTLSDNFYTGPSYAHIYSETSAHTIKITGDNCSGFICDDNQITSLDVTHNTELEYLSCQRNQITILDVSNNSKLNKLYCDRNKISILDVTTNTHLIELCCSWNQLTTLDIRNNIELKVLNCNNNKLDDLDASNNTLLRTFVCSYNQVTYLDVSNATELLDFYCNNNQLTTIDTGINPLLRSFKCEYNLLSASALNDLFEKLPIKVYGIKSINITGNPGAGDCNVSIAEDKGWFVYIFD